MSETMLLVGRNLSPYVRRVAIWCAIQGRPLERLELAATDPEAAEKITAFHPGTRVPALRLADGSTLIETSAICDWLDETMPEKRLVPASGPARRECLQRIGLAHATTEKVVSLVYETTRRPEEYHWPYMQERVTGQIRRGLDALDQSAPTTGFFGGDTPDGSDLAVVICYQMAKVTNPFLVEDRFPKLAALAERAMATPGFTETYPG